MQTLCFPKKGGRIDLLQHTTLSRELSHQYRTDIISATQREEDSQSCPCPALSQLRTVAASISATGLLVQTPHHFYMGLCLPLEASLRVLQQAGWEPLHSCLEGLRLKRGPMLTVPLRPWEELSIPTALSIKRNNLINVFLTCCLTVIYFSPESNGIMIQ